MGYIAAIAWPESSSSWPRTLLYIAMYADLLLKPLLAAVLAALPASLILHLANQKPTPYWIAALFPIPLFMYTVYSLGEIALHEIFGETVQHAIVALSSILIIIVVPIAVLRGIRFAHVT